MLKEKKMEQRPSRNYMLKNKYYVLTIWKVKKGGRIGFIQINLV